MENNLLTYLKKLNLFNPNETVILALSGGVDSMVLFSLLKELDLKIVIAHVNHKKREASDHEFNVIKKMGNGTNVIFEPYVIHEKLLGNFHDKSRNIRYNFFKSLAKKYECDKLILGHHLDDQIETFFMRLVKGATIQSLKGMKMVEVSDDVTIVRPLINIPKEVIEAYAQNHKIEYFQDQSNFSDAYTRNRFRHTILPLLKTENPNFNAVLGETISHFNTVHSLIDKEVNSFLKHHNKKISISSFLSQDLLIQHAVLKKLLIINNYTEPVSKHELNSFIKQLSTSRNNFVFPINSHYAFHREYDIFFFKEFKQTSHKSLTINSLGEYLFEGDTSFFVTDNKLEHQTTNFSEIWYNDTVFPLVLRTRKPGDKIKLKFGHKKIKDLFIDLKIPPHQRDHIVLVCDEDKVLAIPSLGLSGYIETANKKVYIYEV